MIPAVVSTIQNGSVGKTFPKDVKVMEEFGPVLADTCMVVAPIEGAFQRTGTNSAKAGNYLPTLCSQKALCRDIPALMELVM